MGSNMDPLTHSINSARGAAMHAVVRYALWVHRAIERDQAAGGVESNFDGVPEVRDLLELHLNTHCHGEAAHAEQRWHEGGHVVRRENPLRAGAIPPR